MRPWQLILLVGIALISVAVTAVALADHTGTAIVRIPVLVSNDTGSDVSNVQLPFNLSSQTLIAGAYIDSDALNSDVQEGSQHLPYMPGTGRVQMLACFDNAGISETADCNDAGADDITLPATGSEVFEFAFDNQARHLHLDLGTAAIATWTVQWQYYNGSSYVALSNVTDNTSGFTVSGLNRVTWDFPAAGEWPESSLHATSGYWVRAEIISFTSVTTAPLGTQVWYETGRWWAWEDGIANAEQKRYDVHLDVTASSTGSATFDLASSTDDAEVEGDVTGAGYPPTFTSVDAASDSVIVEKSNLGGGRFLVSNALLRFDTSSLPDQAAVTSATLTCVTDNSLNTDGRNLEWEWYSWETAAGRHYEHIAQANAHSGTNLTALDDEASHDFTLTNLHNINKVGYTGLRGHISGAGPSGQNFVRLQSFDHLTISPCSLTVVYDPDKAYHFYVPHSDGSTLADAAALEPGNTFELKVAGYFDFSTGSDNNIAVKDTDFILREGDGSPTELEVVLNGSIRGACNGGAGGDGYHVIELSQGGAEIDDVWQMMLDGENCTFGTSFFNITDNATDWGFLQNGVVGALEHLEYEVNQVTQFTHQIDDLPDHQLDDQTGNGYDVTARYPDTITGYTVALQSAESTAGVGGLEPEPGQEVLGPSPAVAGFSEADTSSSGGFFLLDLMSLEAADTGLPYQFFTGIFGIVVVLVGMVITANLYRSPLPVCVGIIICFVLLWLMGVFPFYLVPLFSIGPGLFFLIWKLARP